MKKGQYDRACPKLEVASKLYVGSGVLLNLADCYEHTGRTASAWTEFGEAASVAERSGRVDDENEAKRRQLALEPRLVRLAIRVQQQSPGLVVKRDEVVIESAAWDTAIPVDPGFHVVSAEAPGRLSWSQSVTAADPGKTVVVEVPALRTVPSAAPASATSSPSQEAPKALPTAQPTAPRGEAPYWTGRRIAGAGIAAAGIVGMGVGGLLGLAAKSQFNNAEGETGAPRHNDSVSAVNAGNVATIVVGIGGAVAVGGLVLWFTAPSTSVQLGTNGGELVVRGSL
jgi:serine/threonine-protein kinase